MPSAERPDPDDARRLVYAHRPSRDTPRAIGRGVPISLFGFSSCGDGAGGLPVSLCVTPGLSLDCLRLRLRARAGAKFQSNQIANDLSHCQIVSLHLNTIIDISRGVCDRTDVPCGGSRGCRAGQARHPARQRGPGRRSAGGADWICESIFGISAVCTVWIIQFSHPLLLSQRTIETLSDR